MSDFTLNVFHFQVFTFNTEEIEREGWVCVRRKSPGSHPQQKIWTMQISWATNTERIHRRNIYVSTHAKRTQHLWVCVCGVYIGVWKYFKSSNKYNFTTITKILIKKCLKPSVNLDFCAFSAECWWRGCSGRQKKICVRRLTNRSKRRRTREVGGDSPSLLSLCFLPTHLTTHYLFLLKYI